MRFIKGLRIIFNFDPYIEKDVLPYDITKFLFLLGTYILSLNFFELLLSALGYFFNNSVKAEIFIGAFALSTITNFFFAKAVYKPKAHSLLTLISITVLTLTIFIAGQRLMKPFYDLSYDGQAYHQETIIALAQGWNPTKTLLNPNTNPDVSYQRILNSYPKGIETLETIIYKLTNSIEMAKSIKIMLIVMTLSFVCATLLVITNNKKLTFLIALFLILNPVVIYQFFSFYIDGELYLFLLSLLALLALYYLVQRNYLLYPIIMLLIILWNIKVTAIVTSTLFIISWAIFFWITKKEDKFFKILIFGKLFFVYFFTFILAFCFVGYNPYITNTKYFKNPFYPVIGKNSDQYIFGNMPESLYNKTTLERLLISIFSKSSGVRREGKTHSYKIPFTFNRNELDTFLGSTTLGGFGPLFSGIFLVTIVVLNIIAVLNEPFTFTKTILFSVCGFILVSVLVIPVTSYARFISQFWIIPCITLLYALYQNNDFFEINKTVKAGGLLLLVVLTVNLSLISYKYLSFNYKKSRDLQNNLMKISNSTHNRILEVSFGDFRSNRIRFKEAGINFSEEKILQCTNKRKLLSNDIPESQIEACTIPTIL